MILHVHVKPNSKTDQIEYDAEGNLKVKIRAQPVDGKANKYLQEYLASFFKVAKSQVVILKGSNNAHKKVEILASETEILLLLDQLKKA